MFRNNNICYCYQHFNGNWTQISQKQNFYQRYVQVGGNFHMAKPSMDRKVSKRLSLLRLGASSSTT